MSVWVCLSIITTWLSIVTYHIETPVLRIRLKILFEERPSILLLMYFSNPHSMLLFYYLLYNNLTCFYLHLGKTDDSYVQSTNRKVCRLLMKNVPIFCCMFPISNPKYLARYAVHRSRQMQKYPNGRLNRIQLCYVGRECIYRRNSVNRNQICNSVNLLMIFFILHIFVDVRKRNGQWLIWSWMP